MLPPSVIPQIMGVKNKRKCPASGCRETLVFSNTIKCRDCLVDHSLKHRFGSDHKCPGPRTLETSFPFTSFLNTTGIKEESNSKPALSSTTSSKWTTSFLNVASSIRASAEAGILKFWGEIHQAWQPATDGAAHSSTSGGNRTGTTEQCPRCGAKFSSISALVNHARKAHERNGNDRYGGKKVTVDVCPKCRRGFWDPVALVEHVERDHGGTSRS